jgi:hypothetical protein
LRILAAEVVEHKQILAQLLLAV